MSQAQREGFLQQPLEPDNAILAAVPMSIEIDANPARNDELVLLAVRVGVVSGHLSDLDPRCSNDSLVQTSRGDFDWPLTHLGQTVQSTDTASADQSGSIEPDADGGAPYVVRV